MKYSTQLKFLSLNSNLTQLKFLGLNPKLELDSTKNFEFKSRNRLITSLNKFWPVIGNYSKTGRFNQINVFLLGSCIKLRNAFSQFNYWVFSSVQTNQAKTF